MAKNPEKVLNISSKSEDERGRILSNFTKTPFIIDGNICNSVEGFIQGIKFPEEDFRRPETFKMWGSRAKKMGDIATVVYGRKNVWWGEEEIPYGSDRHYELIERAIRAKFEFNPEAKKALYGSVGLKLIHDLGQPELPTTSLPANEFIKMLEKIREEIIEDKKQAWRG